MEQTTTCRWNTGQVRVQLSACVTVVGDASGPEVCGGWQKIARWLSYGRVHERLLFISVPSSSELIRDLSYATLNATTSQHRDAVIDAEVRQVR